MTGTPRRTWRTAARATTATLAAIILALSATACGSTTHKTTKQPAGSAHARSALAFARCMRSHGVQHYPDPNSSGGFDKSKLTMKQLAVSTSALRAAAKACEALLPSAAQSSQSRDQTMMSAMSKFARCLRSNGVAHWPDPLAESDPGQPNTPGFPRNMPEVDQNAPQVKAAVRKCQHFMADIGYARGGYP